MARRYPEQDIQRAVFEHLRLRGAPGLFAFHPANGGWRNKTEAAILKGLGVVPGVPDVILIREGRVYALELKTERGKLSLRQIDTMEDMRRAGVRTAVAYGLDAALKDLELWGLLRVDVGRRKAAIALDFGGRP